MKRIFALLAVCLVLIPLAALAQSLGGGSRRVFDDAGLMSNSDTDRLEALITAMRSRHDMDVVILTSNDAGVDQSQAFADDFYDDNGFGTGQDSSGFLFFIDMKNRIPTISTTGRMIRYVTDERLERLLDRAYVFLTDSDYDQAAYEVLALLSSYLDSGIPSNQYNVDEYGNIEPYRTLSPGEIAIAAAAGLACGLALLFGIRWKYGLKGSTYRYDVGGNTDVHITGATDVYLRTHVSKTPKAPKSPSGGSGGRSSTHRSSSGRVHGGGSGRRF